MKHTTITIIISFADRFETHPSSHRLICELLAEQTAQFGLSGQGQAHTHAQAQHHAHRQTHEQATPCATSRMLRIRIYEQTHVTR